MAATLHASGEEMPGSRLNPARPRPSWVLETTRCVPPPDQEDDPDPVLTDPAPFLPSVKGPLRRPPAALDPDSSPAPAATKDGPLQRAHTTGLRPEKELASGEHSLDLARSFIDADAGRVWPSGVEGREAPLLSVVVFLAAGGPSWADRPLGADRMGNSAVL